MYIVYRRIDKILKQKGISVLHVYVGEFATSMEMAGFSISLLRLDGELKQLLARPARTPFFEQAQLKI
jgi:dihydroxyacetone kinase-like protein